MLQVGDNCLSMYCGVPPTEMDSDNCMLYTHVLSRDGNCHGVGGGGIGSEPEPTCTAADGMQPDTNSNEYTFFTDVPFCSLNICGFNILIAT